MLPTTSKLDSIKYLKKVKEPLLIPIVTDETKEKLRLNEEQIYSDIEESNII